VKLFAAIIGGAWIVAFAVTWFTLVGTPTNSPAAAFSDFVACASVATIGLVTAQMILYARWLRRRYVTGNRGRQTKLVSRWQWVLVALIALCPMVIAYRALGAHLARDPSVWAQRSAVSLVVANLAMSFNVLFMIQRLRSFGAQMDLRGGVSAS